MKKYLAAASLGMAAVTFGAPAEAATLISACSAAPLDIVGVSAGNQTCAGYFAGQLLSGNAGDVADQKTALASLGMDTTGFDFNSFTKLSGLGGLQTINFGTPLTGVVYIGVHYGGGQEAPVVGQDSTAFYKIDFGASVVNSFQLQFGATSDAVLYSKTTAPVPEAATWAMMMAGLGAVGASLRRKRAAISFA